MRHKPTSIRCDQSRFTNSHACWSLVCNVPAANHGPLSVERFLGRELLVHEPSVAIWPPGSRFLVVQAHCNVRSFAREQRLLNQETTPKELPVAPHSTTAFSRSVQSSPSGGSCQESVPHNRQAAIPADIKQRRCRSPAAGTDQRRSFRGGHSSDDTVFEITHQMLCHTALWHRPRLSRILPPIETDSGSG
jgi:hypothetical protein